MSASSSENSVGGETPPSSLDQQAWSPEGLLEPGPQRSKQEADASGLEDKDMDREIEEADILYAGTQNTSTRRGVTAELEKRGLEVAELSPQDLEEIEASELEDKTIFYRDKRFTKEVEEAEKPDLYREIDRLDQAGVSMVNSGAGSFISNNKTLCKKHMEDALDGLWFAETPETYESIQGLAREVVGEQGIKEEDLIVKKPEEGSHGKGIEFKQAGEVEEIEEGFTYEQYIPHESSEEDVWDRVSDSRIWVYRKNGRFEIDVVDRENNNEEGPAPTNISQEGEYVKPMDYGLEEQEVASRIADRLDMDVFAIDCIRREAEVDGEEIRQIVPYEANSTAGTQLNETQYTDGNIHEKIAKVVEEEHRGSGYQPGILDRMLQ